MRREREREAPIVFSQIHRFLVFLLFFVGKEDLRSVSLSIFLQKKQLAVAKKKQEEEEARRRSKKQ
jgi:hypothetical protein